MLSTRRSCLISLPNLESATLFKLFTSALPSSSRIPASKLHRPHSFGSQSCLASNSDGTSVKAGLISQPLASTNSSSSSSLLLHFFVSSSWTNPAAPNALCLAWVVDGLLNRARSTCLPTFFTSSIGQKAVDTPKPSKEASEDETNGFQLRHQSLCKKTINPRKASSSSLTLSQSGTASK